ncbi:hypothetical protein AMS68_008040 [Peltaster fructicola]|uniref:Rhodopsin domain-containing protein n=1 Tax=Peltaster fructicola TaxID=286661 RepID=A0A6H0Y693_9PEZI|nr:hypothetical protein AMS68_008040 [Peltaster fructicola]
MSFTRRTLLPVSSTTGLELSTDEIGWYALGPTIAITVLATTIVALRWYTRAYIARCVGNDDLIILISLMLAWTICIMIGLEYGEGLGSYDRSQLDLEYLTKLVVANNDIWCLATNITKASILAQYLRIFASPILRYFCAFMLSLLLLSACWGVFGGTWLCQPMEKLWLPEMPGHCMDALSYWISAAVVNASLDLLVLMLPLPWIMTLYIPHRQKVCVSSLFLLGFFVFFISVVRIVTVYAEAMRGDYIKSGMYAILWSAIEVNAGIICASLIALKPLIATSFPSWLEGRVDTQFEENGWRRCNGQRTTFTQERSMDAASHTPDRTRHTESIIETIVPMTKISTPEHGRSMDSGIKIRDFGSDPSEHS